MFQIYTHIIDGTIMIYRVSDSAWIPTNPANSDYQAYLAWVADGNTAEEWTGN